MKNQPPRLLNLVPQAAGDTVIGRDTEVKTAHKKLKEGAPVMLVNGIGGIGKTTVALKYIAEYESHYQHIAWITVSGSLPEALVTDRELTRSLDLDETLKTLPAEQLHETGCKMILRRLSDLSGCLLVLDNANDLADLLQWQNVLGASRAHVLITSRNEPPGWPCVHVETLPPEQARALFRRHYLFQAPGDAELDALLNELSCHTLLVELSAKAAQASRIPFAELAARIRKAYIHDEALNLRAVDTGQSGQSVETRRKIARIEGYVDLIFHEISQLFDAEKEHLAVLTLLPPAEWYPEAELSPVYALLHKDGAFNPATFDRLSEKGWLQREDDPVQPLAYKIHPLIQDTAFSRLEMTAEKAGAVIQSIADRIHYDSTDPAHKLFEKVKSKPQADYLEKRFRDARTEQMAYLLDRIAYLEENFGQYRMAAVLGEKAYEITQEVFGQEHPNVAVRQSNLANVYSDLGQYDKARDLLEAALESDVKNFGQEHPNVAVRRINLGAVFSATGEKAKARALFGQAYELFKKQLGEEHPSTRTAKNWLDDA